MIKRTKQYKRRGFEKSKICKQKCKIVEQQKFQNNNLTLLKENEKD